MNKVYVGIDVGKNGGVVAIYPTEVVAVNAVPKIKGSQEVDLQALSQLLRDHCSIDNSVHYVIEDVHSIFGTSAKSNFQFGRILGFLEGVVVGGQMPFTKVQPKAWQKVCFEGVTPITKPGTRAKGRGAYDTKAMALIAAQRLYPSVDLRKSSRAEKPHDGIVDALLLAHYAKVKNL